MPRNIPKPKLESAHQLSAFEMTKIHFGNPLKQSSSNNQTSSKKG